MAGTGKTRKTYEIALTGVFLALSVVVLFFSSIVPGIELSLLAISGVMIMIVVHETSIKRGIVFFTASLLLSFLIIPNKSILMLYGFVFGPYTLKKVFIERYFKNKILEYILKLIVFNILLGLGYLIFKGAFFSSIELPGFAWYIVLVSAQIMLVLYDYILTLIIRFYDRVIPAGVRGERQ